MNSPRTLFVTLLLLFLAARRSPAQPSPAATAAFNAYIATVETRLTRQHQSPDDFLAGPPPPPGEPVIESLTPPPIPGALLHHWRGTAFAPHATAASFEQLLRDFGRYPQRFAPQVLAAQSTPLPGGALEAVLRVRQKHVLTVVMDTTFDVTFGQFDPADRFSASRSLRIDELDPQNQPIAPSAAHGFLWRQNSYWTWQQRPGGLLVQLESVSLTRAVPTGLAWAVRPFVQSVPRDSLAFTLHAALNALCTNP